MPKCLFCVADIFKKEIHGHVLALCVIKIKNSHVTMTTSITNFPNSLLTVFERVDIADVDDI